MAWMKWWTTTSIANDFFPSFFVLGVGYGLCSRYHYFGWSRLETFRRMFTPISSRVVHCLSRRFDVHWHSCRDYGDSRFFFSNVRRFFVLVSRTFVHFVFGFFVYRDAAAKLRVFSTKQKTLNAHDELMKKCFDASKRSLLQWNCLHIDCEKNFGIFLSFRSAIDSTTVVIQPSIEWMWFVVAGDEEEKRLFRSNWSGWCLVFYLCTQKTHKIDERDFLARKITVTWSFFREFLLFLYFLFALFPSVFALTPNCLLRTNKQPRMRARKRGEKGKSRLRLNNTKKLAKQIMCPKEVILFICARKQFSAVFFPSFVRENIKYFLWHIHDSNRQSFSELEIFCWFFLLSVVDDDCFVAVHLYARIQ